MGSGSGGSYTGAGGSQPYADTYHVVPKELSADKKDSDIYSSSSGYFKNPTAVTLDSAVNGNSVYLGNSKVNGRLTYVMDKNGDIIFGKRSNPNDASKRSPHPTLAGGKDPQVQAAGMITFKNGKIYSVDNQSGHFRPNIQSMGKVESALQKLYERNPNLFHKDSKWRK